MSLIEDVAEKAAEDSSGEIAGLEEKAVVSDALINEEDEHQDIDVPFEQLLSEADALFEEKSFGPALEKYQKVLAKSPFHRQAINRIARIYMYHGHIKKMVRISLEWQEHLEEQGHEDLAAIVAQAILNYDPHSLEGRLGVLRHTKRVADEATYVAAVARDARYFVEVGSGDLSIKVLTIALDAYPANMDLAIDLADMHLAQGNLKESIKQFRNIAGFYEFRQDYLKAAEAYRRLKMLLPDALEIVLRLGNIYFDHKRYEDAIVEFRNVLHLDYNNREALIGLGESLSATEQYEDAVLAFKKCLSVNPLDLEVREKLADVYSRQDLATDAVKELSTVGLGYMEMKAYSEVKRVFTKILDFDPNNTTAIREISNANDAIAAQELRAKKMAEIMKAQQAPRVKKAEDTPKKEPSLPEVSDDDLYGDDAPELGSLEPLDGEGDDLFAGADNSQTGEMASQVPVQAVVDLDEEEYAKTPFTRILISDIPETGLYQPMPFLIATYADVVPLIQQLITDPPDKDVLPWNKLPYIKQSKVEQSKQYDPTPIPTISQTPKTSGPVRSAFSGQASAFGSASGTFSNAIVSKPAGKSKRRKGRWEFIPDEPPRGYGHSSDAPDPQEELARRLRERTEGSN